MPGRPPKIEVVRNEFDSVRKSSDDLASAMAAFLSGSYQHGNSSLNRKQAERIVSFAFLTLIAGWEEFLFWLYLRYMMGASSPGGFCPTLAVPRSHTLLAASRALANNPTFDPETRYFTWKSWSALMSDAQRHFLGGAPFARVNASEIQLLDFAQTIRNRVAHRSKKCINAFAAAAKPHLGLISSAVLPKGTDPGRLLVRPVIHVFQPNPNQRYYDAYSDLLYRLTRVLAP